MLKELGLSLFSMTDSKYKTGMSDEKPKDPDSESHVRSILKGITWRVVATLVTFLLAHWITGELSIAAKIAGWEVLAKIFVYYLHERAWQAVPRGTIRSWLGKSGV
ncbi:MAG: putative membrane protein [Limisphaerales bacterium]